MLDAQAGCLRGSVVDLDGFGAMSVLNVALFLPRFLVLSGFALRR